MNQLCPKRIECECLDFPISNYTAEGPDTALFCVTRFYGEPPPLGWVNGACENSTLVPSVEASCCLTTLRLAEICAENGSRVGLWNTWTDPDDPLCREYGNIAAIYNTEQTASEMCDDGSIFTAVIPAGTFVGLTQEIADAQALSAAQQQAKDMKFCCPPQVVCCCVGDLFQRDVEIDGGTGPFTWTPTGGAWPAGMDISSISDGNRSMQIAGTAMAAGISTVEYQVLDPSGNYLTKTFTVHAIEITTSSIPDYTLGMPYSYQMLAVGGSGLYAWRLASGTLPAGLTMSLSGLISGTPTAATTEILVFDVIDLECEAADRTFFPPRVALTGRNTTTIATIKGFLPNYQTTTPPKKYKKLTVSGTSEQWADTFATAQQCAGAKYILSGATEIDIYGNYISHHRQDYYAQCPSDTTLPILTTVPDFGLLELEGYCWPADPGSCATCPPSPYIFVENRGGIGTTFLDNPTAPGHTITSLGITNTSSANAVGFITGAVSFPSPPQIVIHATHNYSSLLSDEYTDADALASASVWTGNGLVAETRPRTTGFTSTWTTVQYTLSFSNLVDGESYVATIEFWDNHGSHIDQSFVFTATGPTHSIVAAIPTPPAGDTYEARNPFVRYN